MPRITYLTTVDFGFGKIDLLGDALSELGVKRPLLVTDRGVIEAGLSVRVAEAASPANLAATFDETPPNPTEEAALRALELYRGEDCDGLIALGGGSPMDLAKAVSLLSSHDAPLAQYAAVSGGTRKIVNPMPPVIAVPTTAGTGSEVGRAALMTLEDGRKLGIVSPDLIPARAICDPELTLGLPPQLTAATGVDAIAHCVETYLSPVVNPPAEAIGLDGLARAMRTIERATYEGKDRDARFEMMMAALQGGLCFQKGLGSVHALSHALGAMRDPLLHHGTLNAVLLPPVLRFNEPASNGKFDALRHAMNLDDSVHPADALLDLNESLGLPTRLSEMGVPRQILSSMADDGMADHCTLSNPRKPTRDDYDAILNEVY